ncbi:MAG: hypothetical protein U0800_21165 [Isosphaeraceae bacterium]
MRLRHVQVAVLVLAIAMALAFPAFRRGSRPRASATILARGPWEAEVALITSKAILVDALSDPLYHLSDRPRWNRSAEPEQALAESLRVSPRPGTNLIEISAEADSRAEATAIVDAVLVSYLRTRPASSVHVVQETLAVSSTWSRPNFTAYVALMLGALGLAIAWFAVLIRVAMRIRRQSRGGQVAPPLQTLPGA